MFEELSNLTERREDYTLDFKERLSLGSDDEKVKFLNDVVAFLNHEGGVLVVGAKEDKGRWHSWSPVQVDNEDTFRRQLQDIVESGIAPKPVGVTIEKFHYSDDGRCVFTVLIPPGTIKPYQNLRNGSFYFRGDGKNVVLHRDQVRAMFVSIVQFKELAAVVSARELAELNSRNALRDDGTSLQFCIIPVDAFSVGLWSFNPGERSRTTMRSYSLQGLSYDVFVGCENGYEAKDTRHDDYPATSRLFIGNDGSVHAAVALPIVESQRGANIVGFGTEFPAYVADVVELMKGNGLRGPFYFEAVLDNLQRDKKVGRYFSTTQKIIASPVFGSADDVIEGAKAFGKKVYNSSHYYRG